MRGLADFLVYLIEEDAEETLWEVWLNKVEDKSFVEFKEESLSKARVRMLPKRVDNELLAIAMNLIKPANGGGE